MSLISFREIEKHTKENDCWVVFYDKVYDLSKWIKSHPGGADIILQYTGKDATQIFESFHSKDLLITLPQHYFIGNIDKSTIKPHNIASSKTNNNSINYNLPSITSLLNLYDFQSLAKEITIKTNPLVWNFHSTGSRDEITLRENEAAFAR